MKAYVIGSFYLFTPLADYQSMKEPLLQAMRDNHIKGTIILAREGINGSICGLREEFDVLVALLRSNEMLASLTVKETFDDTNPFFKAKVKLRDEIVTLGKVDVYPGELSGEHVSPQQWNELVADEDVLVIDTRNDYEVELGTFERAINPKTDNFRDFPAYVENNLMAHKDKKIAMFCTGGIRCEKSTVYLKKLGFKKVYQLNGGILNYLEVIPSAQSKWKGTCFVFDERVALDANLNGLEKGTIDPEWKNIRKKKVDQGTYELENFHGG